MLIGAVAQYFFGFTIFVLSSFLVLLVLVQRGRGGGLTGALGGPGGQSAFGTKAGDLFTRITIGVATAWILLCATAVFMLRGRALPETGGVDRPAIKTDANTGAGGAGAGATSSGTTGSAENISALPQIKLPDSQSGSGSTAPADTPTTPAAGSTPAETPASGSATAEAPVVPATQTPATVPAVEPPTAPEVTPAADPK